MSNKSKGSIGQSDLDRVNAMWSRLIACIVHDLTTPLVTLSMIRENLAHVFSNLIEGYDLAVKNNLITPTLRKERLSAAKEALSSEGIESVVIRLLNFLKLLHPYTQQLLPSSQDDQLLNMRECIEEVIKKYPFLDEKERFLLHVNCEPNFKFSCSMLFIEQLFAHLLNNALDFIKRTGQGEINIWTEEEDNYYALHFKDTAQGMDEHTHARVFDRFFSKRDNKIVPGLGFCKFSVLLRGGDILCNSIKGKYTDFVIKFPKAF